MFDAAVAAADPMVRIPQFLPERPKGRVVALGAGKGSARMAEALEACWDGPLEGLVVTRYGHGAPTSRIRVVEAAHPVPDAAGLKAAEDILAIAESLGPDDLCLLLISGGGSALLTMPANGVTFAQKQAVNRSLLASGATITEMNAVRKHLSRIKGGRLALAAAPAQVVNLLISDVPGDDPAVIASGPAVPDTSTLKDARAVLTRYGVDVPASVAAALEDPANETPKPDDTRLAGVRTELIATPLQSLEAAAYVAREAGVTPLMLGDALEGEAREVGRLMAGMAEFAHRTGRPAAAPCVLISGGETTVTVRGEGSGGRNVEFLLGLCAQLGGAPGISAVAADTDGVDGAEETAGAFVFPDTLARAEAAGVSLADAMARYDGHGFFRAVGDQLVTGPTLTNVNDFRAILVTHEVGAR